MPGDSFVRRLEFLLYNLLKDWFFAGWPGIVFVPELPKKLFTMKIQTGQGTIPLITLIALWSISAVISLPGLAITPIMGDLDRIFPHSSDLEIQMLGSLPSLLIIPFILLSGKLSVNTGKIRILMLGLSLFLASGVLYFLAHSMTMLIVVSCLLGIGAGMMIPLATGLIVDFFTGKYRVQQLGMSSCVNNLMLVLATALTGYLAGLNWHYPFLVYLLPAVPLVLSHYLRRKESVKPVSQVQAATAQSGKFTSSDKMHLAGLMWLHFFITYAALTITFSLPFLMQDYHMDSALTGFMISLLFLAIMLAGLFLNRILFFLKGYANIYGLLSIALGLLFVFFFRSVFMMGAGCFLAGLGYGIMQPVIYDKAASTPPALATLALSFVMSVNYLAIVVCPFIIDFFKNLFHAGNNRFPFIFNAVLVLLFMGWAYWRRNSFVYGMNPAYYQSSSSGPHIRQ